jgi:STE24 endopeptidase
VSPVLILQLFALLLALQTGVDTGLTVLNLRHARRHGDRVPRFFEGIVAPEGYRRSVEYTLARGRFTMVVEIVSAAVLLGIIASGLLGIVDAAFRTIPIHRYLQGILFIGAVSFGAWILRLPFSLYSTFSIEQRFGFNRTTLPLYINDSLKGFAISAVIGVPLLSVLFWFMDRTGPAWWVWAFAAATIFQIVMNIFSPMVIAPLFNRFTPLPPGSLRDRIAALAASVKLRVSGIYVVDSSRRSRHSNAYFTGLGRSKRIVLYDTLISTGTEEEIVSVLAHEIGHEKHRHVLKALVVSTAFTLLGFYVLSVILGWDAFYRAFGFQKPSYQAIVVLLAFCSGPVVYFLQPFLAMRSRGQEYQADRFAVRAVGSAAGLRSALLKLGRENLSNLAPHPLFSFFHYTHPTLPERLEALDRAQRELAGHRRQGG